MTPKERILRSIRGQETDRVPWCPFLAYYWENLPENIQKKGQLSYMKDIGADPMLRGMAQLSHPVYNNCEIKETVSGGERHCTYSTPAGKLHLEYTFSPSGNTWFLTKHPVETEEDFKVLQYIYENITLQEDILAFEKEKSNIGEEGLLIPVIGTQMKTAFQSLVEVWCGTENLVYALADFPEQVEECLGVMCERDRENVAIASKSSAEALIFWEDSSTTNISPYMFEKYTLPVIMNWADILHKSDKLLIHHACGHLRDLLPLINQSGIDALESVSPPPTGNIEAADVRKILNPEIALIGGIEPTVLRGSKFHELEIYVSELLRTMEGTRYILANSDSCPPDVEEEKFRLISKLVRR